MPRRRDQKVILLLHVLRRTTGRQHNILARLPEKPCSSQTKFHVSEMDTKTRPTACAEGGEDGFGGVVKTISAGRVVPSFGEEAEKSAV